MAADIRAADARQMRERPGRHYERRAATEQWVQAQEASDRIQHPMVEERPLMLVRPYMPAISEQRAEAHRREEQLDSLLSVTQRLGKQLEHIAKGFDLQPLRLRGCIVCGDNIEILLFPPKAPTSACGHTPQTCSDCLEHWMASEIETKGAEGIKCPECPEILTYQDIQRAASPATFINYDELITRATLGTLQDFAYCLSPTCNSGQENPSNANYMHCYACNYRQCLSHRTP